MKENDFSDSRHGYGRISSATHTDGKLESEILLQKLSNVTATMTPILELMEKQTCCYACPSSHLGLEPGLGLLLAHMFSTLGPDGPVDCELIPPCCCLLDLCPPCTVDLAWCGRSCTLDAAPCGSLVRSCQGHHPSSCCILQELRCVHSATNSTGLDFD